MIPLAFALLFAPGCTGEEEVVWYRFNAEDDTLEVRVTTGEVDEEPVTIDLMSTTGAVVVGTASVTPSAAPAGTDHEVLVQVAEDYAEEVGRATVEADAGDRGIEDYELRQDSADHGSWVVTLASVGSEDEERTDRFTIGLWQEEPVEEPSAEE